MTKRKSSRSISNNQEVKLKPCKKKLTSAPNSVSVSISTAVCTVMCKQPAIRAPFSGLDGPYTFLIVINPGISFSPISIAFRPDSAKFMSATEITT